MAFHCPFITWDKNLANIVYLGLCFFVAMASNSTIVNLQKILTTSIYDENEVFAGDGYVGLAINYVFLAASIWLTPIVMTYIGIKNALIIGAIGDFIYGLSFYLESAAAFYVICALTGISHSLLWTGQGAYLIENSSSKTINRDSLIFYFLYHIATPVGNSLAFLQLNGITTIHSETRMSILNCLNSIGALSVIMFLFLPPVTKFEKSKREHLLETNKGVDALFKAWKVFTNKDMVILVLVFIYTGFQVAFSETIYNSSVGFTLSLEQEAKELVPLAAVYSGVGTILGVFPQVFFKFMPCRWEKSINMLIGTVCQDISYILSLLNLPDQSAFGDNLDMGFYLNSVPVAMMSSALLSVGNICIHTYIASLLYEMYHEESEAVSAVSCFVEFAASAACFFYSTMIGLHSQLVLLMGFSILGLIAFLRVDTKVTNQQIKQEKIAKIKDLQLDIGINRTASNQ
nr:PREDICTED: UNC93-like protein MFSD11 [Bemisia tabaci]